MYILMSKTNFARKRMTRHLLMAVRKKKVVHIIILCSMLFLMSCGKESKKADSRPVIVDDHPVMPVIIQGADTTSSDTLPQNKGVRNVSASHADTDSYDDGYLDGETMSEEDKLAGKPGMQVGMDDDEEDYEDGYDDGYEE